MYLMVKSTYQIIRNYLHYQLYKKKDTQLQFTSKWNLGNCRFFLIP